MQDGGSDELSDETASSSMGESPEHEQLSWKNKIAATARREVRSTLDLMAIAQAPHLRNVRARGLPEGQILEDNDSVAKPALALMRPPSVEEMGGAGDWSASFPWYGHRRALARLTGVLAGGLVGASLWLFRDSLPEPIPVVLVIMWGIAFVYALWSAYGLTAALLNRTTVQLRAGRLYVRHGPLSVGWPGIELANSDIRQLYVKRTVDSGWLPIPYSRSGETVEAPMYELHAVTEFDNDIRLLRAPRYEITSYLERTIERKIGVEDQPVAGEYVE